nr:neurogenic protein mastermind [Ipomoea batatas]
MSYWVRWDSSPNRQLIHEIIDAYEESLQAQSKKMVKNKREKRRNKANNNGSKGSATAAAGEAKTKAEASLTNGASSSAEHRCGDGGDDSSGEEEGDGGEKGAVGRIVSFLGERIWTTIWT